MIASPTDRTDFFPSVHAAALQRLDSFTMGMTSTASARASRYSGSETGGKTEPSAPAAGFPAPRWSAPGCPAWRPTAQGYGCAARRRSLRWLRRLKLWKISHMLMVRKAHGHAVRADAPGHLPGTRLDAVAQDVRHHRDARDEHTLVGDVSAQSTSKNAGRLCGGAAGTWCPVPRVPCPAPAPGSSR